MKSYNNSKNFISEKEFGFAIPSVVIGVAALALPSDVASVTSYSDGWISIILSGVFFMVFALLAVRVAMYFPDQSFFSYTSFLVTRPIAIFITLMFAVMGILMAAYIVRSVSFISQQYLFEVTPMEVLALCFLLVVIYAITGERIGIFRLNVLFLPIILVVFIFVGFFNIKWFEIANFLPLFKTDISGYMKGMMKTFEAFAGFGLGLFYIFLVRNPTNLTKKVVAGISVATLFYLFVFLSSIGIFGNQVTRNLMFPAIELAKRVDIPGGIFERIDAVIFTIWIMAIFNTVVIILDVTILLLRSIFKKVNKKILAFILSPIIFYLSMFPQQIDQINQITSFLSRVHVFYSCLIIVGLLLIAKIRGVKHNEKS